VRERPGEGEKGRKGESITFSHYFISKLRPASYKPPVAYYRNCTKIEIKNYEEINRIKSDSTVNNQSIRTKISQTGDAGRVDRNGGKYPLALSIESYHNAAEKRVYGVTRFMQGIQYEHGRLSD